MYLSTRVMLGVTRTTCGVASHSHIAQIYCQIIDSRSLHAIIHGTVVRTCHAEQLTASMHRGLKHVDAFITTAPRTATGRACTSRRRGAGSPDNDQPRQSHDFA